MSSEIQRAMIAIGESAAWWQQMAGRMEQERNQAFSDLAAAHAREQELRARLGGMLDSYDLLVSTASPLPDMAKDVVRAAFLHDPSRARAILAADPEARAGEPGAPGEGGV